MRIEFKFDISENVYMDDCRDIKGIITDITISGIRHNIRYQVSWFHNGSMQSNWLEEYRLSSWEE